MDDEVHQNVNNTKDDRSLHYTPIHIQHSLAARGCNTPAAAEYTDLQLGGVCT